MTMFNTPLGRKLLDNTMSLGYNLMTAKAKLYSNHYNMIEDFIKRYDSNLYFKKSLAPEDLVPIIQYINDYTGYRIDIKSANEVLIQNIKTELDSGYIKYNNFDPYEKHKNNLDTIKETVYQVGFWLDQHYDKLTFVINTGEANNAVLNIDIELVG